ncbi:unnamed protein product [Urochloa humidicola]
MQRQPRQAWRPRLQIHTTTVVVSRFHPSRSKTHHPPCFPGIGVRCSSDAVSSPEHGDPSSILPATSHRANPWRRRSSMGGDRDLVGHPGGGDMRHPHSRPPVMGEERCGGGPQATDSNPRPQIFCRERPTR